jgi:hypothetical protein
VSVCQCSEKPCGSDEVRRTDILLSSPAQSGMVKASAMVLSTVNSMATAFMVAAVTASPVVEPVQRFAGWSECCRAKRLVAERVVYKDREGQSVCLAAYTTMKLCAWEASKRKELLT